MKAACIAMDERSGQVNGIEESIRDVKRLEEELLVKLLWVQLQAAGFFNRERQAKEELAGLLGQSRLYDRWLETSIDYLLRYGFISEVVGEYIVDPNRKEDHAAVWAQWDLHLEQWRHHPDSGAQMILVDAVLRALPQVLCGNTAATDIIFPNGSMTLVEGIYKNNHIADYFNKIVSELTLAFMRERVQEDPAVRLRILEIGAGTGGTSARVLAGLKPLQEHIAEYCYTDISQAFLLHAQQEYGPHYPFLTYRLYDAQKPAAVQGFEEGAFDLVIATNVLHATRNMKTTIRSVKTVLKHSGLLLLNEMSSSNLFIHLTFGLLEGWWLYEDQELRMPGSPGLAPNSWRSLLEEEGFLDVFFPAEHSHGLGQQIIAAESDGVIRIRSEEDASDNAAKEQPRRKPVARTMLPAKKDEQNQEVLCEKGRERLKALICETLKIPYQRMETYVPLETYGIDSILVVQLTEALRPHFAQVNSTLFFEYSTINALADYLLQAHPEEMLRFTGMERQAVGSSIFDTQEVPASNLAPDRHMKPAVLESINEQQAVIEMSESEAAGKQDVAIIGLSGRYPGARNVEQFWENLKHGTNCITEIPSDRWDWRLYYDEERGKEGAVYSKWGGFLDDIDKFDPLFFQIAPKEAERMDPQERIFLETAYASIEDAGYTPERLSRSGKVGVFVGVMNGNYSTGANFWSIANRLSYLMNFQGPSLAVDTACSSSLTAIHLALESIYSGTSECAIAGGVNLIVDPVHYERLTSMNMLSSGDQCKSFGAQADGFVDGEGVGAVVLKPLHAAIADGDHIYGIIKGSMLNAGGRTNGYTVPSASAQAQLIQDALKRSGVHPGAVSYIEAHGTGTALGDPIEVEGLTRAFSPLVGEHGYCAIGSVKSNIGHCESAAGIAGLTKVLMQMKHGQLAPTLHADEVNPNIAFERTPFAVQQRLTEWKRPVVVLNGETITYPRIAGISSFGAGGANAHLVVQEFTGKAEDRPDLAQHASIIVLSAMNEERLEANVRQFAEAIEARTWRNEELANIAFTLQIGRPAMEERLAFTAASIGELKEKLEQYRMYGAGPSIYRGQVKRGRNSFQALAADDDMQTAIDAWFAKGKYGKLLDLWTKGLEIDWQKLYSGKPPRRVSLPTYPFAKERYWLAASEPAAVKVPFEVMTFQETWQPAEWKGLLHEQPRTVVCFLSDSHRQLELTEAVNRLSSKTKLVFVSRYEGGALNTWPHSIDKWDSSGFERVLADVNRTEAVEAILFLWPLETAPSAQMTDELTALIQGMHASSLTSIRLLVAATCSTEIEHCHAESWIGFERSIGPLMKDVRMSVHLFTDGFQAERSSGRNLWESLWMELGQDKVRSSLYAGGERHVCSVRETRLQPKATKFHRGGIYLITGGFGGIGMVVAEHLAKTYQAKLILTGRSSIDARKRSMMKKLEAAGATVFAFQADVCDYAAMKQGLAEARAALSGSINGVIHAAGTESGRSILEKKTEQFHEVIQPKITGTLLLDELLLEERELDFVAYFSSISAVLGDFGSCDYAVGNRFMTAYAKRASRVRMGDRRHGGSSVSIQWPLWKDGGMSVGDPAMTKMYLQASGQRALEAEQGIALLELLLAQDEPDHLVMVGNRESVRRSLGLEPTVEQEAVKPVKAAPLTSIAKRAERAELNVEQLLEEDLKEHISRIVAIPIDRIDKEQYFSDFGFNSISFAELASSLTKHYCIDLTPAVFFSYPTVEKLIHFYLREHRDDLTGFYRDRDELRPDDVLEFHQEAAAPESVRTEPSKPIEEPAAAVETQSHPFPEPIAIIGMSGRFPEARSVEDMWRILREGRDVVQPMPEERSILMNGENWTCGWVPGVSEFDPAFFEISPREAELMDPRQRLLLQESMRALEDAGYGSKQLREGNIGVFVGAEDGDYQFIAKGAGSVTSTNNAILASRLSYFLNLSGPVMSINTACSSGLVAAHQACVSLRNRECDTAIAAGVNLMLTPLYLNGMREAGMLSPDGKCYAFDNRANGMVPGEAVVAVVMKRLSLAKKDGDPIYAVIRGSGINYDGKTNGITAPNAAAQARLIRSVYEQAGVNPKQVEYIVTHGTGTKLGDPVEIHALQEAFKGAALNESTCALTSPKTNFGHSFAASGLVSLVNLVQAFRHETIPASLHMDKENDFIRFEGSPFYVNREPRTWRSSSGVPLTGAVSAFGMSGTNAHFVLQSYNEKRHSSDSGQTAYYMLPLSAKSEDALLQRIDDMRHYMANQPDSVELSQISLTLLEGRQPFAYRCVIVASSKEEAVEAWLAAAEKRSGPHILFGQVERMFKADKAKEQERAEWLHKIQSMDKASSEYRTALIALAELYCQGYSLDGDLLFGDERQSRIHLPVYPFSRDHYWVPAEASSDAAADSLKPDTTRLLCKEWIEEQASADGELPGKVAILTEDGTRELAMELKSRLPGAVVLHSRQLDEMTAGEVEEMDFDACIDLLGCSSEADRNLEGLPWLQRLIDVRRSKGIKLIGVTKGLERFRSDAVRLSGACRAGLYRMLQSEYANIHSRHVDIDASDHCKAWAEQLIAELHGNSEWPEICYRKSVRYRACLREQETTQNAKPLSWPEGHVLWITGGTRGLGALCARHYVETMGVKRLVLLGREALPPRETWENEAVRTSPMANKIRLVKELEKMGADVRTLDIPLTDTGALKQALLDIREEWGPAGGVIHCAGVGDREYPAFVHKPTSVIQQVLEPKVGGLMSVWECFKDEPLAFFALFSSVSAAVPSLAAGQSDYAMANSFMDYFAQAHANQKPIISIQWPSWKESGMGEVQSGAFLATGMNSLTDREGLRLLDHMIANPPGAVVLPAVVQPDKWQPERLLMRRLESSLTTRALTSGPLEVRLESQASLPGAVRSWLLDLFAAELKLERSKLELIIPIQDYGADSIILAQLIRTISRTVGKDIDPSVLYEHTTIQSLADWLTASYGEPLTRALLSGSQECQEHEQSMPIHDFNDAPSMPEVEISRQSIHQERTGEEDIAVVGMSSRFPGAKDLTHYWSLLTEGRSAIRLVPKERWGSADPYYAGLLDELRHADPSFFHIPDEDARAMDPQALLILEESVKALLNAGYNRADVKGKAVGVYIGARTQYWPGEELLLQTRNPIVAVGQNYLAANISRFLDLRGPSMVIDTACSSALTGMSMAIQSLRSGDTVSALVGGVSLLNSDFSHKLFGQRGILSKSSTFHVFDGRADGVVLSEGAGVVLLKTVKQALADGDRIYAVIKGIAVNNDGKTAGPAAPNMQAQKDVMLAALKKSGRKPSDVSYIETNGSGSEVTDLLELKTIQQVYGNGGNAAIALGSIKPNIGHPLSAEGIASFIKVVLMLDHGQFVPFLSGELPMRHFDLEASPFFFHRETKSWSESVRTAAINCFGDGGTNVHAVIESWQEVRSGDAIRKPLPWPEEWQESGKPVSESSSDSQTVKSRTNIWKMKAEERKVSSPKSFWGGTKPK